MKDLTKKQNTNKDFYNFYVSLNKKDRQKLIGMKVSYLINGDSYKRQIVEIRRNGKTIVLNRLGNPSKNTTNKTYTYKNDRYSLKGCHWGGIDFNSCDDYRTNDGW